MASYNRVILMGNLAQDPELKYLPNGTPMCKLRVAVSRDFANQQGERETDFFTVVAWRRQAETSAEYLAKGRPVMVEGRLQTRSWEAPDGQKRSSMDIVADRIIFLGSRERSDSGSYNAGGNSGDFGGGQGGQGGQGGRGGNGGHDDFGDMPVDDNVLPETDDEIAF